MCGITGFLERPERPSAQADATLAAMTQRLHHRGPDDRGRWHDPATGIGLGQTRLSIVDLSPAGHQPMVSHSGRYVFVFNGEVYNHAELREPLQKLGHTFRGTSDTETLVEHLAQFGILPTLEKSIGMFAWALWDRTDHTLTLARDRLGIKPLYYGWLGPTFLFGSELKSLKPHPDFRGEIDRNVLPLYLRHNYVPAPWSIYRNIFKVPAGHYLRVSLDQPHVATPQPWWQLKDVIQKARLQPFCGSYANACDQLEDLLSDAVRLRMLADVPVGAFLSGGIDSSLVTALMQRQSTARIRSFSIGFEDPAYNEAPYAKAVATHLGTDHTEFYVTAREALDVIPQLPTMFDEPFGDSSQIPTYLLCRMTRREVTVALSGDGGDELFCGYRRYFEPLRFGWMSFLTPGPLRAWGASALGKLATHAPAGFWKRNLGRASRVFAKRGLNEWYLSGLTHWPESPAPVLGAAPYANLAGTIAQWPAMANPQERWMALDTTTYLPDDILTKVDRTSMAVALEARVPLIDHRVVALAWSLPPAFKVQGWQGKRILRDVLARHVPRSMFERPKTGFGAPIHAWLRGPLRDWTENLLSEDRLTREGWLNVPLIRSRWEEHRSGVRDWHYPLWDILMFNAWLDAERTSVVS